jgi:hypothetical protein
VRQAALDLELTSAMASSKALLSYLAGLLEDAQTVRYLRFRLVR